MINDTKLDRADYWSVDTYSVRAPKSNGGKYRRPVDVVIIKGARPPARTAKVLAQLERDLFVSTFQLHDASV